MFLYLIGNQAQNYNHCISHYLFALFISKATLDEKLTFIKTESAFYFSLYQSRLGVLSIKLACVIINRAEKFNVTWLG